MKDLRNKKDKKPDKAEDEKNNEENQWMDIQLNSELIYYCFLKYLTPMIGFDPCS